MIKLILSPVIAGMASARHDARVEREAEPAPSGGRRTRSKIERLLAEPHWPLTVLLVGFPLWWLLGLSAILPIALAVPMARQLMRRHPIRVPRGFGLWLIFLVFVAVGVAVLWVDAPGAVPGGGSSRLIVFGYRLLWYLACTVVLLWVGNLSEDELPTLRVIRLLGWMFVVTALGGLLGVLIPRFEVTSLVEMMTPGGLRSNAFVKSLIHPRAANESTFLGRSQFRPMAPFSFANSWGANFAMLLPFFLVGWMGPSAKPAYRRIAPFILIPSAIPVVYSLNRGLWISLGLGLVFVVVRLVLSGRVAALASAVAIVIVGFLIFLATPLATLTSERLETAHSNDRRGELLSLTVSSTLEGSPVLGYGSTRDVQGSFASIAGGATADCSACEVPPLGTQGHVWLVIFSQGVVGALFFLAFFIVQARNHIRAGSTIEAIGLCLLLFFAFQIFIYDTLEMPFYTLMITIGLMWRERTRRERLNGAARDRRSLEMLLGGVRRRAPLVVALTLVGAGVGIYIALQKPPVYNARGVVVLAPAPVDLDPDNLETAREITIDTEAALVFAERTIARVREEVDLGNDATTLRDRIFVTAPPVTKVLNLDVRDVDPERAERTVASLAENYLRARNAHLAQRRDQAIAWYEQQLEELDRTGSDDPAAVEDTVESASTATELRDTIDELSSLSASGGEILRLEPAWRTRAFRQLYVVSGAMVGFLAAIAIVWLSGPRPDRRRARGREGQAR